jgi:hypothetical protein
MENHDPLGAPKKPSSSGGGANEPIVDPSRSASENSVTDRVFELGNDAALKAGQLVDDARDTISGNPLATTLTVFGIGLVTGAILGALLARD